MIVVFVGAARDCSAVTQAATATVTRAAVGAIRATIDGQHLGFAVAGGLDAISRVVELQPTCGH